MEMITGIPAKALIKQAGLDSPLNDKATYNVLDNAAGAGVATVALFESLDKADRKRLHVVCADIAPNLLQAAETRFRFKNEEGWNIKTKVADAQVRSKYGPGDKIKN